ncbi:MAG: hypothetical protein IT333_00985 [Thermomicrobiales bacterium]|jgi:hypothetical protein|nr:hypothetical protein [Thermomicrobiales bacterium]
MYAERWNLTAVILGLLFIVIGALFLLDEFDVLTFDAYYMIPLLVIGAGVAVLFGGRRSDEP